MLDGISAVVSVFSDQIPSYPLERMGVILLLLSKLSIPRRGNADLSLESLAKCYF